MNVKKTVGLMVGVILAVGLPSTALAQGAGSANSIVGGGWRLNLQGERTAIWAVSARSDPNGGSASGSYYFQRPGAGKFTGTVTCLRTDGQTAVVGGRITTGTVASEGFVVWFHDGGSPRGGQPGPDLVSPNVVVNPTDEGVTFPDNVLDVCPTLDPGDYGLGWRQVDGDVLITNR